MTIRKALRVALEDEPMTSLELSGAVGVSEREVLDHLEHIERSVRREGKRLVVEPAVCHTCGFVFGERRRLGRPSRCPKCKSEHLQPPRYCLQ